MPIRLFGAAQHAHIAGLLGSNDDLRIGAPAVGHVLQIGRNLQGINPIRVRSDRESPLRDCAGGKTTWSIDQDGARRSSSVRIDALSADTVDDAAALIAREHRHARDLGVPLPVRYLDVSVCGAALRGLLSEGFSGFVARQGARPVGVMCGRTLDGVGFVPAHGIALDPGALDPSKVMVALFAELAPVLVADGAVRVTVDHVDHESLAIALLISDSDAEACSQSAGPNHSMPNQRSRSALALPLISIQLQRSVTSSFSTGRHHRCMPSTRFVPSPKPVPSTNASSTTARSTCSLDVQDATSDC
jgi:hypothetical protein